MRRIRRDSLLPPVTSRTKKFASLAPMSHVCAPQPPDAFCSKRTAGVLLVFMCRSSTGVDVRKPTRPVESTNRLLVAAPAVIVNGTFAPETSSIENLFAPPEAESFAVSCQSFDGYVSTDVSSNLIRVLFSLRRSVSKPNDSLFTQSKPTHRLPWTMLSSGVTTSSGCTVPAARVRFGVGAAGSASPTPGRYITPPSTWNVPPVARAASTPGAFAASVSARVRTPSTGTIS